MRVLLATAPWSFDELYPGNMAGRLSIPSASPPLGILYLSACLKEAGHEVDFFDGQDQSTQDFLDEVDRIDPQLIGFHATTFSWQRTVDLAATLKQTNRNMPTVAGGPHVTGMGREALLGAEGLDFILSGDAERTICQLADAILTNSGFDAIPGLGYRSEETTRYQPHRFVKDLDELPLPDYDLVDIRKYPPSIAFYDRLPSMTMMTTRGCPSACTFCDAPSNYRERSLDKVVEEIRYLKERFGLRHVLFYDEDLALNRRRLIRMCRRFVEEGLDISWCCNARADNITEDVLAEMKAAGCWRILIGVESGSQRILDQVSKGITLDEIRRRVALVKKSGIEALGTFVFGFPGETWEDGQKTIDFAVELDLDYAIFLKLTPFPGTEIAKGIEARGRITGLWAPQLVSFVPDSLTEEQLARLSAEAVSRFYMRPRYLLRRAWRMRSLQDLERNLRGFASLHGLRSAHFLTR